MEKLFHLKENHTDVKTEVMAGITTFMTMAYILAVNPNILSAAGMDAKAVLIATSLAAFVGTMLMAFLANYPFALAPGMGLNAYFAYTVVLSMGYSWQMALLAVFVEGIVFIVLSLTNVREGIFNAIPMTLKSAVSVGIGLFVAFVGLQNAKLIVNSDSTLVTYQHFKGATFHSVGVGAILALLGVVITAILLVTKVKGGILYGILITWVLGIVCELTGIYVPDAEAGMYSVIPTAFVSYTGEALDKKTPLLRSMNALSGQAVRILKLFGKDVDSVSTTVGPEQEYFLVKKEDYEARQDLILTGRTLFGAPSAKGQELEEHYFGVIRPEVSAFMKELDEELWKLGVPAKTKHNEVAPCQHELAPIFDTTNVAIDHNLLTMEMMRKIAPKYGLVCLQHEKPFEGVNGSGKHNNWSMSTTHENLLDPGDTPMENLQFLIFLAAVIKAVDEYADLLRTSVATPGNDHRLGANEAPPAIISIFVGEELEAVIDAIASDSPYAGPVKMKMDLGVDVLPKFSKDTTDRNRTSPFAFTGNKFEFRMPGSAENLSDANTILNTAVAKELKQFVADVEGAADFECAAAAWVKKTLNDHRRVIFNGNGYSEAWEAEAARHGYPARRR